jgi:hypothetical protein
MTSPILSWDIFIDGMLIAEDVPTAARHDVILDWAEKFHYKPAAPNIAFHVCRVDDTALREEAARRVVEHSFKYEKL